MGAGGGFVSVFGCEPVSCCGAGGYCGECWAVGRLWLRICVGEAGEGMLGEVVYGKMEWDVGVWLGIYHVNHRESSRWFPFFHSFGH